MRKLCVVVLLLSCLSCVCLADEAARVQVAKKVTKEYSDALVWVSAISKTEISGIGAMLADMGEQEIETVGTVIDPSGLTVISGVSLDPLSVLGGAIALSVNGEKMSADTHNTVSDVKMTLPDGTEIDAKVIMKDPDLNLAFVMPQKSKGAELPKFKHIPLDNAGTAELLDPLVTLGRLSKSEGRECTVHLSRVSAVVTKPRKAYHGAGGFEATPVFNKDGKILGLCALKKQKSKGGMLGGAMQMKSPSVVPAEDIQEIAKQALETAKKSDTKS